MKRLSVAVLVLVALLGIGCDVQAPPAAPRKSGLIRLVALSNLDVRAVPMLLAMDDLRSQGYTVEPSYVQDEASLLDGVSHGDAEIAQAPNASTWAAIAQGAPVRTFVEFTAETTILAVRSDIKTCGDLAGKRLALPASTGMTVALMNLYFRTQCNHVQPQVEVLGTSPARIASLVGGQMDGALMPGPEMFTLDAQAPGKFHTLLTLAQQYPNLKTESYVLNQAWAAKNPEIVKDFLRALLNAQRNLLADPQLLYNQAGKRLKLDRATVKQIADSYESARIWDPNGGLTNENLQATLDFMVQNGILLKALAPAQVADLSYLNSVLDEIGRK